MSELGSSTYSQNSFSTVFAFNSENMEMGLFYLFRLVLEKENLPVVFFILLNYYETIYNCIYISYILTSTTGLNSIPSSYTLLSLGVCLVLLFLVIVIFSFGNFLFSNSYFMKKSRTFNTALHSIAINIGIIALISISKAFYLNISLIMFLTLRSTLSQSFGIAFLNMLLFIALFASLNILSIVSTIMLNKNNYFHCAWKSTKWSSLDRSYENVGLGKKLVIALVLAFNINKNFMLLLFIFYIVIIKVRIYSIGYSSSFYKYFHLFNEHFEFLFFGYNYLHSLGLVSYPGFTVPVLLVISFVIMCFWMQATRTILLQSEKVYYFYFWIESISCMGNLKSKAIALGMFSDHRKCCTIKDCVCEKLLLLLYSLNRAKSSLKRCNDENTTTISYNNITGRNSREVSSKSTTPIKEERLLVESNRFSINEEINNEDYESFLYNQEDGDGSKSKKMWIDLWIRSYSDHLSKSKSLGLNLLQAQLLLHLIFGIAYDLKNPYQAIIECKTFLTSINNKFIKENSYLDYLTIRFNLFMLEENIKAIIVQNQLNDINYYSLYNNLIHYNLKYENFLSIIQQSTRHILGFLNFLYDKKQVQNQPDELVVRKMSSMFQIIIKLSSELSSNYHDISEGGFEDYKVHLLFSKLFEYVFLIPMMKTEIDEKFEFSLRLYFSSLSSIISLNHSKRIKFFNNPLGCAISIISGNIKDLGIIKYANAPFQKLTGYSAKEIVYSNITKIMPECVGKHHNYYLKNFYRSENSSVLDHIRSVPLKTKDMFLSMVEIMVKIFPSFSQGLCFIGYLIEHGIQNEDPSMKSGIILVSSDLFIEGISKEITLSTGFVPDLIPKSVLNKVNSELNCIQTIIPSYTNAIHELINDSNFEPVNFSQYNEKSVFQPGIKNSIKKSQSQIRDPSKSSSLINQGKNDSTTLSFLIEGDSTSNLVAITGIVTELEAMENDLNTSDMFYDAGINDINNIVNKDEMRISRLELFLSSWKDKAYCNFYNLTFAIKTYPFVISKMDLNLNFLLVKIYKSKKETVPHFNSNLKPQVLTPIKRHATIVDSIEVNTTGDADEGSVGNFTNNNSDSSIDNAIENMDEVKSIKKLNNLGDNRELIVTQPSVTLETETLTKTSSLIKYANEIKVKSIKNKGIKNLIQLFRNSDYSLNNESFASIKIYFRIFTIVMLAFFVLIYTRVQNGINTNLKHINTEMILFDLTQKTIEKSESFYLLLLLRMYKQKGKNTFDTSLLDVSLNKLESLMSNFLFNLTENSNSNTFALLEVSGHKPADTDFLYADAVDNLVINPDFKLQLADKSSLITQLDFFDYTLRKIVQLSENTLIHLDFSDLSNSDSLKTASIFMNVNYNLIYYILNYINNCKDTDSASKADEDFKFYLLLTLLFLLTMVGSSLLSNKVNSVISVNNSIFKMIYNISSILIRSRIRSITQFDHIISQCSSILYINSIVKQEFQNNCQLKYASKKGTAIKVECKDDIESSSGSSSISSIQKEKDGEQSKKKTLLSTKLQLEIIETMNKHPDFTHAIDTLTRSASTNISNTESICKPLIDLLYKVDERKRPLGKSEEAFSKDKQDIFLIEAESISLEKSRNWPIILGFNFLVFIFFSSYYILIIILKYNLLYNSNKIEASINFVSIQKIYDSSLLNSVIINWYSAYLEDSASNDSPNQSLAKLNLAQSIKQISQEIVDSRFGDLRTEYFISSLTFYEIFSVLENYESDILQEYSLKQILSSTGSVAESEPAASGICDFLMRFLNYSEASLENGNASFLSSENTKRRLSAIKPFIDPCIINSKNSMTYSNFSVMSKREIFLLTNHESLDILSQPHFQTVINSLVFRCAYASNLSFMIRLLDMQLMVEANSNLSYYALASLIVLVATNLLVFLVLCWLIFENILKDKVSERCVVFLFPIENIITHNYEFFQSHNLFK